MTRKEFKEKAKEIIDNYQFGSLGKLFDYDNFEDEMKVSHVPNGIDSSEADTPLVDFLNDLYDALEQQPCEDCVSKQAVAKIINTQRFGIHQISMGIIKEKIESLPSIRPTRKKGKWIRVNPLQENDGGAFMCSICRSGDWDIKDSYSFCPNCGAEMEGEE